MNIDEIIKNATGAQKIFEMGVIQTLWSGYGKIRRYGLKGAEIATVVVKHVNPPKQKESHKKNNNDLSHKRKLRSYQVETAWYKQWSHLCDETCHVPKCFGAASQNNEVVMVMEDLDAFSFSKKKSSVSQLEIETCLSWLANFHAAFMGKQPENLWKVGTYWHLKTRPDELKILTDLPLKEAAYVIDQSLKSSPFQTFVHGDAKLENFCFTPNGKNVAAIDFQYVGGGCGMKDVAYFMGSCFYDEQCEKNEKWILDFYFKKLKEALIKRKIAVDTAALEQNWRQLFPVAWTDFHRFLKGWNPGHFTKNSYSERLAAKVIATLKAS